MVTTEDTATLYLTWPGSADERGDFPSGGVFDLKNVWLSLHHIWLFPQWQCCCVLFLGIARDMLYRSVLSLETVADADELENVRRW